MPIQILRTVGDVLYSKHGLCAECPRCNWYKQSIDLAALIGENHRLRTYSLDQFRKALVCSICKRPEPDLFITFISPLH